MKLLERARQLKALGLLPADADLAAVVAGAESGEIDVEIAPATALLTAGGVVLAIGPEDMSDSANIPKVLAQFQAFCGNLFKISDVQIRSLGIQQLQLEIEEGNPEDFTEDELVVEEETFAVTLKIDGKVIETEVTRLDDTIDLGFVADIQEHLESLGEKRQLCPLVELVDDDARFLFADAAKVEDAELREIITAPEFEDDDE